ncbi:MAG: D-hexose-6-phosphate mutarotase [Planctomycetota bacterium]
MDDRTWLRTRRGELCLWGAHVTRWQPRAGDDALFLSARSRFEPGVPIRGGVPLVFPWFGDDPEGRGRPAHGFARRVPWRLLEAAEDAGTSRAVLQLDDDDTTRALWPHRFRAHLDVTFGDALELEFAVENRDAAPLRFEALLHTYLRVGDVRRVLLRGLAGARYFDKTDGMRHKVQDDAPLRVVGEVDRTYVGAPGACAVEDPVLGRTLHVHKEHAASTVVWNPWVDKARALADLGDDEYLQMLCVESGNVMDDAVMLAPGERHALRVRVEVS